MSQIIASNARTLSQLNSARAVVNAACSFRLFQNDVALGPATLFSWFVESTFPGYARQNTAGKFGVPLKVENGRYQVTSDPFDSLCTGDSAELVYGWTISLGSTWFYAAKFPAPVAALDGVLVSVVVALQEASLALCC